MTTLETGRSDTRTSQGALTPTPSGTLSPPSSPCHPVTLSPCHPHTPTHPHPLTPFPQPRWTSRERASTLHKPYVGCSINSPAGIRYVISRYLPPTPPMHLTACPINSPAGISLPARTWSRLAANSDAFCSRNLIPYDDAIHAMQNANPSVMRPHLNLPEPYDDACHAMLNANPSVKPLTPTRPEPQPQSRRRLLEPSWLSNAHPRCLHVGRCGGISFDCNGPACPCNVTSDLHRFVRTWVRPMLPGGELHHQLTEGARQPP